MWSVKFWSDVTERAVSTAAQTFVGLVTASELFTGHVNWAVVGGAVGGAAVLSVAKALAASRTGDPESASLLDTRPADPAA